MIPHTLAGPGGGRVHVIGASGRSGSAFCKGMIEKGFEVHPVVRDRARWAATGLAGEALPADLGDPDTLGRALGDARTVVSCAHARHVPAILAAAPAAMRFVFLGSTRKFTRWPDAHGNGVLAGEAAFLASGRSGVMLHPTMIYGAAGEDNVQRLAALLKRLPVVPLPAGGRSLVQPIHQDDLTACLLAAVATDWDGPHTRVVAGPSAVTYAEFVRAVAAAAGFAAPRIVPVPVWLLLAGVPLTHLPGLPGIGADEVRRLAEDKAFASDVPGLIGRRAVSLAEGLERTLGHQAKDFLFEKKKQKTFAVWHRI